ncbi:MAG: pyridoxamine 5'-phosphate oxidase family protein [Microcoleaceae cyanobacterium]
MSPKFAEIAFTPAVKAIQEYYGSREAYQKFVENGPANDTLTPDIIAFIQQRDSFYLGSVSETGWPYIQFRGGPVGFLRVIDDKTLGFADFSGNNQFLSTGNFSKNDRAFLFLMDYPNRRRLKIWGRAKVVEDAAWIERLRIPGYTGNPQRAFLITVEAWDRNCPQHIPRKYSEDDIAAITEPLLARIAELEAQLEQSS